MLKLCGIHEDLVQAAVAEITAGRGTDLSAVVVVYPGQRFRHFLQDALGRACGGACFAPRMYTIEALVAELFTGLAGDCPELDELAAVHVAWRSARAVYGDDVYGGGPTGDFVSAYPWAHRLWTTIEEILVEGGRFRDFAPAAFAAFTGLGDYHEEYRTFLQRLPRLIQHFLEELQHSGRSTRGRQYHDTARAAAAGTLPLPQAELFLFVGFNALNRCEEQLLHYIFRQRTSMLLLRGDSAALHDPLSPFALQRETLRALELPVPPAQAEPQWSNFAGKVRIHRPSGMESQMVWMADVLRRIAVGRDEAGQRRIAVALPSPAALLPFVQGVVSRFDPQEGLRFNITLGYPLRRTPLWQLLDTMLQTAENAAAGRRESASYLALLRHPYVRLAAGDRADVLRRAIHRVEQLVEEENLLHISPAGMEQALAAVPGNDDGPAEAAALAELHAIFLPDPHGPPIELPGFLARAVQAVAGGGDPGEYLFLQEYTTAALAVLEKMEAVLREIPTVFREPSFGALARLVRQRFEQEKIAFEGSPLAGIQVMGMLEFRGLKFDHVLVADAVEGVLPETAKYDPLLPYDIRRLFGIRCYPEWDKLFASHFFSMTAAAEEVHLFVPSRGGEGEAAEPSRFVERIVFEIEKRTAADCPMLVCSTRLSPAPTALRRIEKSPAVLEKLCAMPLSPSALDTYIRCPLRFYFSRILRLEERRAPSEEADAGMFGTIAHETLQEIYTEWQRVQASPPVWNEEWRRRLEETVVRRYRANHFDPAQGIGRIRSWVLTEKLAAFLEKDFARLRDEQTLVVDLELDVSCRWDDPSLPQPVQWRGKIDRLEAAEAGLRVVDYKTGSAFSPACRPLEEGVCADLHRQDEARRRQIMRGFLRAYPASQLLLYGWMTARQRHCPWEDIDAAYVFLRAGEDHYTPVFGAGRRGETPQEEKRLLLHRFQADTCEVLRDLYLRPDFSAQPDDESHCAYCPYRQPCGNT